MRPVTTSKYIILNIRTTGTEFLYKKQISYMIFGCVISLMNLPSLVDIFPVFPLDPKVNRGSSRAINSSNSFAVGSSGG